MKKRFARSREKEGEKWCEWESEREREMRKKANNLVERSLGETWCCKKCWEMWRGYTIHDIKIKFLPTFYQTNFSSTTWNIFFPFVIGSKRALFKIVK